MKTATKTIRGAKKETFIRFTLRESTHIAGLPWFLCGETNESFMGRPRSVYLGHFATKTEALQEQKRNA